MTFSDTFFWQALKGSNFKRRKEYFHIFFQDLTDFQYMSSYLQLNVVNGKAVPASSLLSAAACVDWVVDEPHTLTRAWCTDLINFVNKNPLDGKVR